MSIAARQLAGELSPGADAELPEHFAEVVVDGAEADEQLAGDVVVGRAGGGQVRDGAFLRS
jgi:hypothetical protein